MEWANPENYTPNTSLRSIVNGSYFAKMTAAEERFEDILRATIENVPLGDDG